MKSNKLGSFGKTARTTVVVFWQRLVQLSVVIGSRVNHFWLKVKKNAARFWRWLQKIAPGITVILKLLTAIINLINVLRPYIPKLVRWISLLWFIVFPENGEPLS